MLIEFLGAFHSLSSIAVLVSVSDDERVIIFDLFTFVLNHFSRRVECCRIVDLLS